MSEIELRNFSEIPTTQERVVKHGDKWGDWVLNLEPKDNPSLDYVGTYYQHNPYWIPLSELETWRGLNRWMHHLNEKDWGHESIGDFVKAVMTIHDLPFPE